MNDLNNLNLALHRFIETLEVLVLIQIFVINIDNAVEAVVIVIQALLEILYHIIFTKLISIKNLLWT